MLAVKEGNEQVYFLKLVNDSTLFKEEKRVYWKHYQREYLLIEGHISDS